MTFLMLTLSQHWTKQGDGHFLVKKDLLKYEAKKCLQLQLL